MLAASFFLAEVISSPDGALSASGTFGATNFSTSPYSQEFSSGCGALSLGYQLEDLLERAGIDQSQIQSRTNFRLAQDECYVFVTFITEQDRTTVKHFLSSQKFSWSYQDGYNYVE